MPYPELSVDDPQNQIDVLKSRIKSLEQSQLNLIQCAKELTVLVRDLVANSIQW